jgi:uncharacterized protein YndB with AHSA1/START domain
MATIEKTMITVETKVNAPVEKVWIFWTDPKHIIHWNNASLDWHTPRAQNDLRVGGRFLSRMEARDGTMGFDFSGEYTKVTLNKQIFYTMDDGREARISFSSNGNQTSIKETFEAEHENTVELQRNGWQSILNNFKKYIEAYDKHKPIRYEILISASPERVYDTTIGEKTYSKWTSEFNPTSHFVGSWEKGSKILFIGTDQDGSEGGMVSSIRENIPNEFISIEHQGILQLGKEVTSGPEAETWVGATENYTFTEENGKTRLSVEMDAKQKIGEEFRIYFDQTWPKALRKLKAICEE